ncbi:hypothetical protein FGO68_gene791 [Halteria grandinella]|uniref:Transmembrane protein n=1 Tax=Halteria grandinella TaxID=5974 RepID=A0A8J8NT31_HALGN|nr:hypothetical protein FGO68_gene791 [Halteria grandinella]
MKSLQFPLEFRSNQSDIRELLLNAFQSLFMFTLNQAFLLLFPLPIYASHSAFKLFRIPSIYHLFIHLFLPYQNGMYFHVYIHLSKFGIQLLYLLSASECIKGLHILLQNHLFIKAFQIHSPIKATELLLKFLAQSEQCEYAIFLLQSRKQLKWGFLQLLER